MSGQNGPPGYPTPRGKAYYAAFRVVSDPVRHNSRVDKVKRFGIFIAVLCVTALIVGGAVLWVGPQLVGLAVFDDQRDQPYMILDFARGGSSEIMRTRYEEPLTGLVASEGGVFAGRYTMSHLLEGTRADEWSRLNRFHMAQAQDIAKVMTSSPYRLLREQISGFEHMQIGDYVDTPPRWGTVLAVWLVENHEDTLEDPLAGISALLPLGSGRVVWDAAIDVLSQSDDWQRIFVVEFTDELQATKWLRHMDMVTARGIANAQARRMSLALYVKDE